MFQVLKSHSRWTKFSRMKRLSSLSAAQPSPQHQAVVLQKETISLAEFSISGWSQRETCLESLWTAKHLLVVFTAVLVAYVFLSDWNVLEESIWITNKNNNSLRFRDKSVPTLLLTLGALNVSCYVLDMAVKAEAAMRECVGDEREFPPLVLVYEEDVTRTQWLLKQVLEKRIMYDTTSLFNTWNIVRSQNGVSWLLSHVTESTASSQEIQLLRKSSYTSVPGWYATCYTHPLCL